MTRSWESLEQHIDFVGSEHSGQTVKRLNQGERRKMLIGSKKPTIKCDEREEKKRGHGTVSIHRILECAFHKLYSYC